MIKFDMVHAIHQAQKRLGDGTYLTCDMSVGGCLSLRISTRAENGEHYHSQFTVSYRELNASRVEIFGDRFQYCLAEIANLIHRDVATTNHAAE